MPEKTAPDPDWPSIDRSDLTALTMRTSLIAVDVSLQILDFAEGGLDASAVPPT